MRPSQGEKIQERYPGTFSSNVNRRKPLMFGDILLDDLNYWALPPESLESIAGWMLHLETCRTSGWGSGGRLPAGYTYLGQLVTHDIVESTTTPDSRRVTPWLNLDSIYPDFDEGISKQILSKNGLFLIGSDDGDEYSWDYRRDGGKARIMDHRNDENIILAQIVVEWMKFHNRSMSFLNKAKLKSTAKGGKYDIEEAYSKARAFGTLVFQSLVVYDYLEEILPKNIYEYYFFEGDQGLPTNRSFFNSFKNDSHTVPLEFSHGAFRFGHSMVRGEYVLRRPENDDSQFQLTDLLKRGLRIPESKRLDWDLFFFNLGKNGAIPNNGENTASPIDIFLASGTDKVPVDQQLTPDISDISVDAMRYRFIKDGGAIDRTRFLDSCRAELRPTTSGLMNLAIQDIKTSSDLPTAGDILLALQASKSGVAIFELLGIDPKKLDDYETTVFKNGQVSKFDNQALVRTRCKIFEQFGLGNTPLWLFCLMEAESLPFNTNFNSVDKNKLGPLAGLIVADVLASSIENSRNSIYNDNIEDLIGLLFEPFDEISKTIRKDRFAFRHINNFMKGDLEDD